MSRAALALILVLSVSLGACAGNRSVTDPIAVTTADLVRPRCEPPASLLVDPGPLPPVAAGANMVETSIKDTLRYNEVRRQLLNLIAAVERCQKDL